MKKLIKQTIKYAFNRNLSQKNIKRSCLFSVMSLVTITQAHGFEFNVGEIEGQFDSQLSIGSSWRMEKPDSQIGDDSIGGNEEDGNRNFKEGDAFSQVFKGSHDLQFS